MINFSALRRFSVIAVGICALGWVATVKGDVDPKVAAYIYLKDVPWKEGANGGSATYIISGDPTKEGSLYVMLQKWHPHHNSMPHFHPHDRFITVLSGTWWVGTGRKYDMGGTTPMKAGAVVTHYANQIHYDGAKDEEAVLEIVGIGVAQATQADGKKE